MAPSRPSQGDEPIIADAAPAITIGICAVPTPTEGGHSVKHAAEPTAELRQTVYSLAEGILVWLGDLIVYVNGLAFTFVRDPTSGELRLDCDLTLTPPTAAPITVSQRGYSISLPHMQTPERLKELFVDPLFHDLALAIDGLLHERSEANATISKWFDVIGQPEYPDLY